MNAMSTMGNDLVREARKRAGLTQRELADKAGRRRARSRDSNRVAPSPRSKTSYASCGSAAWTSTSAWSSATPPTGWQAQAMLAPAAGRTVGACGPCRRIASARCRPRPGVSPPEFEPGRILAALAAHAGGLRRHRRTSRGYHAGSPVPHRRTSTSRRSRDDANHDPALRGSHGTGSPSPRRRVSRTGSRSTMTRPRCWPRASGT